VQGPTRKRCESPERPSHRLRTFPMNYSLGGELRTSAPNYNLANFARPGYIRVVQKCAVGAAGITSGRSVAES